MSDVQAEAAARLIAQITAETGVAPQEVGTATAGETPAAPAEAAHVDTSAMTSVGAVASAATQGVDELGNVPAVAAASATEAATAEVPNVAASTSPAGAATDATTAGEVPNAVAAVDAGAPEAGDAHADGGELPNAASVAGEPTTALGSASNAAGESITSTIGASSVDALPKSVAAHLEAIYALVVDHVTGEQRGPDTGMLRTLIGDVLYRISNGMDVRQGELVTKLEALYQAL